MMADPLTKVLSPKVLQEHVAYKGALYF